MESVELQGRTDKARQDDLKVIAQRSLECALHTLLLRFYSFETSFIPLRPPHMARELYVVTFGSLLGSYTILCM